MEHLMLCLIFFFFILSRVFVLSPLFFSFLSLVWFPYEKIGGIFVADLNSSSPLSPACFILDFYAFYLFLFHLASFPFKASM